MNRGPTATATIELHPGADSPEGVLTGDHGRGRCAVSRVITACLATAAAWLALAGGAGAATTTVFTNATPITIPKAGNASPYPSFVSVAGLRGTTTGMAVTLHGFTHPNPEDVDILLVPPSGRPVILMADACGSGDLANATFLFASNGPYMGSTCDGVTYRPTNGPDNSESGATEDVWPDAPARPYDCCALNQLQDRDPNGLWRLYVRDDQGPESSGTILRGWSLTIGTLTPDVLLPGIGSVGIADPYPVTSVVSGESGVITDVDVSINGVSHQRPDDLDLLLVGPRGEKVMLASDACGGTDGQSESWRLDDEAAGAIPDSGGCPSGGYRPTDYEPGESLPAPAPAGPYGTSLAAFDLTEPNGEWRLYASDDQFADTGWLATRFALHFQTRPKAASAFTPGAIDVTEGQAAELTLTRSATAQGLGAGSVTVTSAPGSATSGGDFDPVSTTMQFAPGETQKTIPVRALADPLPEGAETFTLTIAAAGGDAQPGTPATATVTIRDDDAGPEGPRPAADRSAPETRIKRAPKRRTKRRTARLRFVASERGARFQCKLDKRKFKPCTSPRTLRRLRPGRHRFQVRATDAAGNVDPTPAKHRWRVVR